MGPLVTAASLQHVAGIENSAMQLVLMRCSLDLTSNYESGLILHTVDDFQAPGTTMCALCHFHTNTCS